MISKNRIKLIRSLKQKKYRQKYDKFTCEGTKICIELLDQPRLKIESLIATSSWLSQNDNFIDKRDTEVVEVDDRTFKELSYQKSTDGVLLVVEKPKVSNQIIARQSTFYLDQIRDPGNLGTMIRICDWFGLRQLYLSPGCVDPYSAKTVQSSMASITRIELIECAIENFIDHNPGFEIVGADICGDDLDQLASKKPLLIVIGNEANGISQDVKSMCHRKVRIPGKSLGAESLNARG